MSSEESKEARVTKKKVERKKVVAVCDDCLSPKGITFTCKVAGEDMTLTGSAYKLGAQIAFGNGEPKFRPITDADYDLLGRASKHDVLTDIDCWCDDCDGSTFVRGVVAGEKHEDDWDAADVILRRVAEGERCL